MTMMNIQTPEIGISEDITTNTMTVVEMEQKRVYKRKDCGDTTNTPTAMKKRKDCGDTNTMTVIEMKQKIAYKRKECGDTINTPTAMKKRKDCGDTNTSSTKKRRYIRKDCIIGTNTPTVLEKKKRPYRRKKYLPHDFIVKEILTKLPVPTLLKSVRVSKLWYNSIHNDHERLTYSHFLQSQKQPQVIFSLSNVRSTVPSNTDEPKYGGHFFKFTTGIYREDNCLRFDKFRCGVAHTDISELVGYCNGLPCIAQEGYYSTAYIVLDPNRNDYLCIFYPASVGKCISNAHIICHGFGFDPSANEYKLVSIFCTAQNEFNAVVFTLGTKSWRNVTATSMPLPVSGGPVTKIRAPTGSDKSAIFYTSSCSSSGCLAWKVIVTLGGAGSNSIQHESSNAVNNNEMEMLLSFNLHDEKFQFIQLPAKRTIDEQKMNSLVDYPHLLEFKGSPCIALIEKVSANESDYSHRCRVDHQSSSCCCCCCKVHLYILKDNVKQVWVNEESFDVSVNSTRAWRGEVGHLAPEPCCFCFGSTTTPPTRICSFSDQILLYWFKDKYLQVYNLRSEKLQLVVPNYPKEDAIFGAKMKEPRHRFLSGDDDISCSNMDYQLHCHVENLLSLQTFIPEGVAGVEADDFRKLDWKREDRPSPYALIDRGSRVFYPFF